MKRKNALSGRYLHYLYYRHYRQNKTQQPPEHAESSTKYQQYT